MESQPPQHPSHKKKKKKQRNPTKKETRKLLSSQTQSILEKMSGTRISVVLHPVEYN